MSKKKTTEEKELPRIVRYTGEEGEDIPFKEGDLIRLIEEDDEGYFAVLKGSPPEEEDDAITVFPGEIEELDEEELEEVAEEDEEEAVNPSEYEQEKASAARHNADKKLKVIKTSAPEKKVPVKKVAVTAAVEPKELVLTKHVKDALKGKSAVSAARQLVKQAQATDYTLGGVLSKVEEERAYEREKDENGEPFVGKDGFERFVELDLGIKYRKARYLMTFYQTFAPLGITEGKLLKAKYTKTKEILDVVQANPESAEEWLEKAGDMKLDDLQAELTKARKKLGIERTPRGTGGQGNAGSDMVTIKVRFFNDQAKVFEKAIDKAKKMIEVGEGDTEDMVLQKAMVCIVTEWLDLNS
jgi:hypothetical protein